MPVKMGYGAFRPTRRNPYFPGTEPAITNTGEQYQTASTGVEQHGYYYDSGYDNTWATNSYTLGNQYAATGQGYDYSYYQSGTGQAYDNNSYDNSYVQAENSYGQTSTSGYTAASTAAVAPTPNKPPKEPTTLIVIRKLPGRDKQRSRTAIRDLVRDNIPQTMTLTNADFSFVLSPEGEPLDYVYVRFKTREEATAAKEQLDGQWLEIGTKRRKVEVAYAREVPGKKDKDKGKGKAKEAPLVVDGSYASRAQQAPPLVVDGSYAAQGWEEAGQSGYEMGGQGEVPADAPLGPAAMRRGNKGGGKGSGHRGRK
ncbi:hypothetical protein B0T16DRAFT_166321 [Cercophora newfieldiana]|uniref:RRM domain-containing protein n=1 Tax=Cercophora newfieldiana TaxID=92897 RepID=A0AA39Y635_9PEZI|nr:hypothetical protein B0T16DRAFT_166321 [Cercophora newfieldiana]